MRARWRLVVRLAVVAVVVVGASWWLGGLEDDDAEQWCRGAAQLLQDGPGDGGDVSASYAARCP
jgi:hypothetical protein